MIEPRNVEKLVGFWPELTFPPEETVELGRIARYGEKGQRLPVDGNDGLRLTPPPGAVIDFNGLELHQPRKNWDPDLKGQEAAIVWQGCRDVTVKNLDGFGGKPDSEAPRISGYGWEANVFMQFIDCDEMSFENVHGQSFYGDYAEFVGVRNNTERTTPIRNVTFGAGCSSWGMGRNVFSCHAVENLVVTGNRHQWFNGVPVDWEVRYKPDSYWVNLKSINGDWRRVSVFDSAREMIRAGQDYR